MYMATQIQKVSVVNGLFRNNANKTNPIKF